MKKPRAGLRIAVFLLFMIGLLSPVATAGAGAQDVTCDDFTSTRAAQALLDSDPSMEEALDPDGDGIACNEDTSTEDEETPTEEDEDTTSTGDDAEAYLADVQDEVDGVLESFDRYEEIMTVEVPDATQAEMEDLAAELEELATGWSEYPDVAADLEAPTGLEDVGDAYTDFADAVGETGDTWLAWWDIPSGEAGEDEALDEFTTALDDARSAGDDVTAAIEDAGGSSTDPTEDPTEEPSGDADAYLADVQDSVDDVLASFDRYDEINATFSDATDAEKTDMVAELEELANGWSEFPDVAADLEAPAGMEDVGDAYTDFADAVGETGDAWLAWWDIPSGEAGEDEALDEFTTAFDDARAAGDDVTAAIEDAGGSSTDPTEDPTEEPSGDADAYLADVRDSADEWNDGAARFLELIGSGSMTDAEVDELADIVTSWSTASEDAAALEAPAGSEDIQEAYQAYADEMTNASGLFADFAATDPDSPESEDAIDAFVTSLEDAQTLYDELDALLTDAGV